MSSPRACPNCKQIIAIDRGYCFDEHLNMICRNCSSVVVSISEHITEPEILGEKIDETV